MSKHRKLLVLDIDHTLIHTVLFDGVNGDELVIYQKLLKKEFPNARRFPDEPKAVIVPRPHLAEFTNFLDRNKSNFGIGIYSTGTAKYLSTALTAVFPWAIGNARFIWDVSYCKETNGVLLKDLAQITSSLSYPLEHIRILDDSDVVVQKGQRIVVEPFLATELKKARSDDELLRIMPKIERWASLEN